MTLKNRAKKMEDFKNTIELLGVSLLSLKALMKFNMAIISFTKLAYRRRRNLLLNMIKRRGVLTGVCSNLFVPATHIFIHSKLLWAWMDWQFFTTSKSSCISSSVHLKDPTPSCKLWLPFFHELALFGELLYFPFGDFLLKLF